MPISRVFLAILCISLGLASCCGLPAPQAPAAKTSLTCTFPSTSGAGLPAGPITGGTFSSSGSITITAGTTINLSSDLVIWSDGNLTIDGDIKLPFATGPGAPKINITLGAKKKLTVNGFIGYGQAATGAPATGTDAFAKAGDNGGFIKLKAGTIDIAQGGKIIGNGGGSGGDGTATGAIVKGWLFSSGGDANAVGGSGGNGGDVILCGDLVTITGDVWGGWGGNGGFGTAAAAAGHRACACGGNAGVGGDVIFGPGAQVDFKPGGTAEGGNVFWAGVADASVLPGAGGNAEATGGQAAGGGTVRFMAGAVVITTPPPTTQIESGTGGDGGDASATGGVGANGRYWPDNGGDARATGTNGGPSGPTPSIPLPNGTNVLGTNGGAGKGGKAYAIAGNGGSNTGSGTGASSGSASAHAGANGAGSGPTGGTTSAGPVAAIGPAGGIATPALQNGAP